MAVAPLPPNHVRTTTIAPRKQPSAAPLPLHHQATLSDIAHGVEETEAGICTKYLIDLSTSSGVHELSPLHDVERCMDNYGVFALRAVASWHGRIKRARRALQAMSLADLQRHVAVLHIAFGAEDPATREWQRAVRDFYGPQLVSLARYTDATEERRMRLVRAAAGIAKPARPGLAELSNVVQLFARREREAYHERIITSGDALRAALSPDAVAERPAFLSASKAQATGMLSDACANYHAAWIATP